MKITVTGSLGHISKPLTEALVKSGHTVTLISSDAGKAATIEALGAIPAIGSVQDTAFLTKAFTGADAVYTMVPPTFSAADWKQYIRDIGTNYATAIKSAGVKNVVNLSSIGAHMPTGAGPVSGIHYVEETLNALEDVNVLHLRPGYFYTNFYNNVGMIKHMGILGSNNSGSTTQVMVHPDDIASFAAKALQQLNFTGKSHVYIVSDIKTAAEVAAILGEAIGKPALPWVEFTDQQAKEGMIQAGLPEEVASNFVEMGVAMRTGQMFEDFKGQPNGISFETFAKEFAANFN